MQLCIARSAAELDLLRPAWDKVYAPGQHAIFQSFAWNRMAAEAFGDREAPYVVHVESSSGSAIIPAAIGGGRITLLGEALFDYRDVLVAGDIELLSAGWRELARLDLPFVVPAVRGRPAHWHAFGPQAFCDAPFVAVARQNSEQFTAAHRRTGRFVRRVERAGCELRHYDGAGSDVLRTIYRNKGAQEGSLFADARRTEFMIAAAAIDPSAVDVYTFEAAGRMVAALVTLRDGNTRRFYTTWFDPGWARHSPGTALLFEVTRESLAEDLDCDYMTGTQLQKQRFATDAVPLFRIEVSAERLSRIANEPTPAVAA